MEDDPIRSTTLNAFKQEIIVYVSTGNKNPNLGSISNGCFWCLNVGACTSGKIKIIEIEVGIKTTNDSHHSYMRKKDIKMIDKIDVIYLYIAISIVAHNYS